jgi:nucleoside 2-deoxyribosyltransferase
MAQRGRFLFEWDSYNPYDGGVELDKDRTANEVFDKDIYWLDKSDIILVNLNMPKTIESKKGPFFTILEMGHAFRERKPIIAYTNTFKGRYGYDRIVTKTLPNLEECLDYIIQNY